MSSRGVPRPPPRRAAPPHCEALLDDDALDTCADAWHHFDVYSASLYWAIVTITSVGYGDICPTNVGEMRLGVLALLAGGIFWAYIIGNVCGIVSTLDVDSITHRQRMDQLNYMMEDMKLPAAQRVTLRGYFQARASQPAREIERAAGSIDRSSS